MSVVYCDRCRRAFSKRESASIIASARRSVLASPLSVYGVFSYLHPEGVGTLGPHRIGLLDDAGIATIGDALRAGDSVLDIDGIGPRTLVALDAIYEYAWGRELDKRGATTTSRRREGGSGERAESSGE